MKRYFNFIILIVGISCAMSYNLPQNETKYDKIDAKTTQNSTSDHLTVHTEMETSRTMTDPLGQDGELSEGRTFFAKRLGLMLLPIMFKAGVMGTLLVIVAIFSFKSFVIGFILLLIKVSGFLAKLHHSHHEMPWYPPSYSWPQPQLQPLPPIHVHVYNDDTHHHADLDHIDHHAYSKLDYIPAPLNPYKSAIPMNRLGLGQYSLWNQ